MLLVDQSASTRDYGINMAARNWILSIVRAVERPAAVSLAGFDDRIYEYGRIDVLDESSLTRIQALADDIKGTGLVTDLEVPFRYLAGYEGDIALAVVITDGEPEIWDESWLYLSERVLHDERYGDLNAQYKELRARDISGREIFERLSGPYAERNLELTEGSLAKLKDTLGPRLVLLDIGGSSQHLEQWAGLAGARYVSVRQAFLQGVSSALTGALQVVSAKGGPAVRVQPAEEETGDEPAADRIADMIGGLASGAPEDVVQGRDEPAAESTAEPAAESTAEPAAETAAETGPQPEAEEEGSSFGIFFLLLLAGAAGFFLLVRYKGKAEKEEQAAALLGNGSMHTGMDAVADEDQAVAEVEPETEQAAPLQRVRAAGSGTRQPDREPPMEAAEEAAPFDRIHIPRKHYVLSAAAPLLGAEKGTVAGEQLLTAERLYIPRRAVAAVAGEFFAAAELPAIETAARPMTAERVHIPGTGGSAVARGKILTLPRTVMVEEKGWPLSGPGPEDVFQGKNEDMTEFLIDSKRKIMSLIGDEIEDVMSGFDQIKARLLSEKTGIAVPERRVLFRIPVPAGSMIVNWTESSGEKRSGQVLDVSMKAISFKGEVVDAAGVDSIECPPLSATFKVSRSTIRKMESGQEQDTAIAMLEDFAGGVDEHMRWVEAINSIVMQRNK